MAEKPIEWFYLDERGEEAGPVTSLELRVLASGGVVCPNTLLRRGREGQWGLAKNLKGLFGAPTDVEDVAYSILAEGDKDRLCPPPRDLAEAQPLGPPSVFRWFSGKVPAQRAPREQEVSPKIEPARSVPDESSRAGINPTQTGAVSNVEARARKVWPALTAFACAACLGSVIFLLPGKQSPTPPSPADQAPKVQPLSQPDKAIAAATQQPDPRPQASTSLSADALFAKASPAVVRIEVHDHNGQSAGGGSGFIVSADGLIATNHHVIEHAHSAHAEIMKGDKFVTYQVEGFVALDRRADLALLKINASQLPTLQLAGRELPPVGTKVYAIGSPKGLRNSLSEGLVSGHRVKKDITWIQTTTPVSFGSSGGALLSAEGTVVGVPTWGYPIADVREGVPIPAQNLNFACPASYVIWMIDHRGELQTLASLGGWKKRLEEERQQEIAKWQEQERLRRQRENAQQRGAQDAALRKQALERATRELAEIEQALEQTTQRVASLEKGRQEAVHLSQFQLKSDALGNVYGTIYNGHNSFYIETAEVLIRTNLWVRRYTVTVNAGPLKSSAFVLQTFSPNTVFQGGWVMSVDWPKQHSTARDEQKILDVLRRRDELRQQLGIGSQP